MEPPLASVVDQVDAEGSPSKKRQRVRSPESSPTRGGEEAPKEGKGGEGEVGGWGPEGEEGLEEPVVPPSQLGSGSIPIELFTTPPQEGLTCMACESIPASFDVRRCPGSCGRIFCSVCAKKWLEDQRKDCPICRHKDSAKWPAGRGKLYSDLLGMHWIRCPFTAHGCETTGKLGEMVTHAKSCPHGTTTCPKCFVKLRTKNLERHQEFCLKRIVGCKMCGVELPLDEHPDHIRLVCKEAKFKCRNEGCGEVLSRQGKARHAATCPHQLVECGLCQDKVRRGWMEEHLSDKPHTSHLLAEISTLKLRIAKMEQAAEEREFTHVVARSNYVWEFLSQTSGEVMEISSPISIPGKREKLGLCYHYNSKSYNCHTITEQVAPGFVGHQPIRLAFLDTKYRVIEYALMDFSSPEDCSVTWSDMNMEGDEEVSLVGSDGMFRVGVTILPDPWALPPPPPPPPQHPDARDDDWEVVHN